MVARTARVPMVFEADPASRFTAAGTVYLVGKTVAEALGPLNTPESPYRWIVHDGVVVIRPRREWTNARNPLNQPVENLAWNGVNADVVVERVRQLTYGPGTATDHVSRISLGTRLFSVAVQQGSVLDVLIASARAHGELLWSTAYPAHPASTRYSFGYHSYNDTGMGTAMPKLPPSLTQP